jgi:hypothetical protein
MNAHNDQHANDDENVCSKTAHKPELLRSKQRVK